MRVRWLLPLILTGCAATPRVAADQAAAPDRPAAACDAAPAQRFVGQRFQPSLSDAARRASGARTVRLIRPGMAVTMDYRVDRLNIELDARDTVTALRCG